MRQGDAQRFDIGLLGSTRILQLRLQLQRSLPDIEIEKEQAWLEFDFGETKFGAEQWTQRIDVEECAARQGARLLPTIEPVSGRDEAHPPAPRPTIGPRQSVDERFTVVALGAFGRDQQMAGTLEFITKRLMANDVDLLGLDKSPVGTLMLGDCGRSDREMRNGSGRDIQVSHESISCRLIAIAPSASARSEGSEEVTGIAGCSCDGDAGCPMLSETTSRLYCTTRC